MEDLDLVRVVRSETMYAKVHYKLGNSINAAVYWLVALYFTYVFLITSNANRMGLTSILWLGNRAWMLNKLARVPRLTVSCAETPRSFVWPGPAHFACSPVAPRTTLQPHELVITTTISALMNIRRKYKVDHVPSYSPGAVPRFYPVSRPRLLLWTMYEQGLSLQRNQEAGNSKG